MKPFAIALFAATLLAQEPAGIIRGSVRDSVTKAPIEGAEVSLEGSGPADTAATTITGSFRFEKLAPGDYDLSVKKQHYLDSEASFIHQPVRLKAGAVTEDVTIELTPLSSAEGSILGEDGRPLEGVTLRLGAERHTSDKDGHFRVEDLAPGEHPLALTVPDELRDRLLVRDPATRGTYGYAASQYYPGVDDPRLASPLNIAAGVQVEKVEIRLRRTLLVDLSGRLVESAGGEPLRGAEVALVFDGRGAPAEKQAVDAGGGFRFRLIQPGHYALLVYRAKGEGALPYVAQVDVGRSGMADLPVAVPPFARLQGSVKPPDSVAGWEGGLNVRLRSTYGLMPEQLKIGGDGAFTLDHVPPGEYRVFVEARNLREARGARRKLFVQAIRLGSQSVLASPLSVAEGGNPPLEIVLSSEVGRIAGRLTDSEPGRVANAMILVHRVEGEVRSLADMAGTTADGAFDVAELAPGDYEITAWAAGFAPSGRNQLRGCAETARVKVKAGEATALTVQPCK